jgi:hypothetical protein
MTAPVDPRWEQKLTELWAVFDRTPPRDFLTRMQALTNELPPDHPVALFELAGTFDSLGQEARASPGSIVGVQRLQDRFRTLLDHAQQDASGAGWLPVALLPVPHGRDAHTESRGKLALAQAQTLTRRLHVHRRDRVKDGTALLAPAVRESVLHPGHDPFECLARHGHLQ